MKRLTKYILIGIPCAALFIPFAREFFWFNTDLMFKVIAWNSIAW